MTVWLYSGLGIAIGIAIALQTAINGGLRRYLRSPFLTSAVSFCAGTLSLLLFALLSRQPLSVEAQLWQSSPWWLWIGGALGLIGLTSNILIFPQLGGVQTALLPILGQILMGMLIDQFAWFGSRQIPFTLLRGIGLLLMLAGIFLAVVWADKQRHYLQSDARLAPPLLWLWRALGVLSGMFMATQAAINGRLAVALASPVQAALISFALGSVLLLLYVLFIERSQARLREALRAGMPWYLWTGGLLGGIFVCINAFLVPALGTGQTVVLILLGMISGGLLVDHFGLFGALRKAVLPLQVLGLLCLMAGVAMIRLL